MPIPIEDYQSRSAGSELGKAAASAFWFAMGTETGWKTLEGAAKVAYKGFAKPIAQGIYRGARYAKGPIGFASGVAARGTVRAAKMYGPHLRDIAGGAALGAYRGASWLYKHPATTVGLVGGAGALWAAGNPNERTSEDTWASPSIVEAMGGQSDYGVRGLMQNMNASGDMVFGMNARR